MLIKYIPYYETEVVEEQIVKADFYGFDEDGEPKQKLICVRSKSNKFNTPGNEEFEIDTKDIFYIKEG